MSPNSSIGTKNKSHHKQSYNSDRIGLNFTLFRNPEEKSRLKTKNKINEKFTSEEVKITEQSEKSLINRFRALKEIKKHEIH